MDACLVTFIERDIFYQVYVDDIIDTFMSFRKAEEGKLVRQVVR